MAGNQRLNATITIGGTVSASLGRAVQAANAQLGNVGKALGRAQAGVGNAIRRNDAALDKARVGIVDSVGAYYTLKAAIGAPVKAAADFETDLEDIDQKAGVPVEKLGELGARIRGVAKDTNQSAMQIGSAIDALAGRGASLDVAMKAADPIGRAAVAYRAATDDLAAASWAAVDNLKVPADQIETALDMMAQAGKEGAFELRDMATYFPSLGAAYQGLGQKGVGAVADLAAALQVVRKGTGDASSAATNLQNVLQKIYAPGTVKKFDDMGVDIFKEMEAAAKRGLTPIEAIAELTNKTLDGDLSKMGWLFEDAQVQAGLRTLIQGMDEYREIRKKAMGAKGVVDEDYERRIRTAQGATDRWNASVQDLNITFGTALLPVLNDVLDKVIPVIGAIGQWIEANPELAATLATVAGSLIAVRGAVATLRFVGLLGKGGALSLLSGGLKSISLIAGPAAKGLQGIRAGLIAFRVSSAIGGLGPTLVMVWRAALGLLNPFRLVGLAIRGIGAALAATPVGAVVAAIAAGAYLLYKHWGEVGAWFGRLWGNVKQAFAGASEFIIGICTLDFGRAYDGLISYWTGLGAIFNTIWDGICATFTAAWTDIIAPILDQFGLLEAVKTAWAGLLAFLDPLLTKIGDVFKAVWAWIKPVIDGLKWVMDNGAAAADRVSSFRTGNSAPGGGADAMADGILGAQGYAVGGSFRRGPILVGEHGPEMRYEDRSGFIAHNRQLVGMARNAARIAALGGALGAAPLAALPVEDISAPGARNAGAVDRNDRSAPISVGDIHIHAQPGQDPRAIADAVLRELDRRSRGALFDGGL